MSAEPVIPVTTPHRWVFIACLVVVGLSVLPLPYVYYAVLRIIIFGSLLWLTLREYAKNRRFLFSGVGVFTLLGLIFYNPLLPVHLGSKIVWFALNLAGLYLIRHLMTRDLATENSDL